ARRHCACAGTGARDRRWAGRPVWRAGNSDALAGCRLADRRARVRLPAMERRPASPGVRGARPPPAFVRSADRRLSGPGIPELASDFVRSLTRILTVLALSATAAQGQITLKSPSWNDLSPRDRQTLAPLSQDWNRLDAAQKQKWLGLSQRYPGLRPDEQQRIQA